MWVWRGQVREVCGWCGTRSPLIYFLHLLWLLRQDREHSLSRELRWGVRAWNQLCQHNRGTVCPGGFFWRKCIPWLHSHLQLLSVRHFARHLIHPGLQGIKHCYFSNSVCQAQTLLIRSVIGYFAEHLSECLMRIFLLFAVVSAFL